MSDDNKVLGASEDQAGSIRVSDAELSTANVTGWPERIWLQSGCDEVPVYDEVRGEEVTWCADNIHDSDVEYVRADLAAATAEQPSLSVPDGTSGCSPAKIADTPAFWRLLHNYETAGASNLDEAQKELLAHIDGLLAQQREAGRRDMHETNIALVAENCRIADRLNEYQEKFAALATRHPVAPELSDEQQRQEILRPLLSPSGMADYLNGNGLVLYAETIDRIIDRALLASIPSKVSPVEPNRDRMLEARNDVFNAARKGDVGGALKTIEQHALVAHKGSGIAGMCRDIINNLAPVEPRQIEQVPVRQLLIEMGNGVAGLHLQEFGHCLNVARWDHIADSVLAARVAALPVEPVSENKRDAERWRFMCRMADALNGPEMLAMADAAEAMPDDAPENSTTLIAVVDAAILAQQANPTTGEQQK